MKTFQDICTEEFDNVNLLKRGGQKVVYEGNHKVYGESVVKLYFQLNDPRALREIEIEKTLDLPMIPQIYDKGTVEYEGSETLYIIEEKILGTELRQSLNRGMRFSLEDAVYFLEQGLNFIVSLEKRKIVHRDIKPENIIRTKAGKVYFLDLELRE